MPSVGEPKARARGVSPKVVQSARRNGRKGGRPKGATIANGAKRPGCPTPKEIADMILREPEGMHPTAVRLTRWALKRITDVAAGAVGSKAAPHVLRAAIHLRAETVGEIAQIHKLGISHSMLISQVENEGIAESMRLAAHGDPEGKALLAEYVPVEKLRGDPITDPVVAWNYVPRRSDFDPQVAMAEVIERMADREARRRTFTIDQIIDMPFASPDRNHSGEPAEE